MASIRQPSFAGGELAPALYGRSDLEKYASGSALVRNFIVSPQGRLLNRPGTSYIAQNGAEPIGTPNPVKPPRLIPFIVSDSVAYVIVLTPLAMNFYRNGQQVQLLGSPFVIATPWSAADCTALTYAQQGTLMTFCVADEPPYELTWLGTDTTWSFNATAFDVPLPAYDAPNTQLPAGFSMIGPVTIPDPILGTSPATTTVNGAIAPVFSKDWQVCITEIGVYNKGPKQGVRFESAPVAVQTLATPIPAGATFWDKGVTYGANANVIVDYSNSYYTSLAGGNINNYPPTDGGAHWSGPHVGGAFATQAVPAAFPRRGDFQFGVGIWQAGQNYAALALSTLGGLTLVSGICKWFAANASVIGLNPPPTNTSWNGPFGPQFFNWSGKAAADPGWNVLGWNVYVGRGGTVLASGVMQGGVFGLVGTTLIPLYADDGSDPDFVSAPPQGLNPFKAFDYQGNLLRTENPAVVTFFQQRRLFANTWAAGVNYRPGWLFGSKVGDFSNFDSHLLVKDSDSYAVQLASRRIEDIRAMVGKEQLIIFTGGGVWGATAQGGAITASDIQLTKYSELGSSFLPPILIGQSALYVRARGLGISEVEYDVIKATYDIIDWTVLARHLFDQFQVTDWCYQQDPHQLVWCVRNDGQLLVLTYVKAHQVWAWAHFDVGGVGAQVVGVCSVPDGQNGDAVYIAVFRPDQLRGASIPYTIEKVATRLVSQTDPTTWTFLDFSVRMTVTTTGQPTIIGGLPYTDQTSVKVLINGVPAGPYLVSNPTSGLASGSIDVTTDFPDGLTAANVLVGVSYLPQWTALDLTAGNGEVRTKRKNVREVVIDVFGSVGISAGESLSVLRDATLRDVVADSFSFVTPKTEQVKVPISGTYTQEGRASIQLNDPVPLEILGVTREVEVSGP